MKFAHAERTKDEKSLRIDLGLALLSCLIKPNESLTWKDIAAWCDCSYQAIHNIEKRALRHLRNRLSAEDRATFLPFITRARQSAKQLPVRLGQ